MKLYAIALAWLGGLSLPFVRRSKIRQLLFSLESLRAEEQKLVAIALEFRAQLATSDADKKALKDEDKRLRAMFVQANAENARLESEITRLNEVLRLAQRDNKDSVGLIEDIKRKVSAFTKDRYLADGATNMAKPMGLKANV